MLLEADAAWQKERVLSWPEILAASRCGAFFCRGGAKAIEVEEVVDDADMLGIDAGEVYQLVADASGVCEDGGGAVCQGALDEEVAELHGAVATGADDDRDALGEGREACPEVRFVAEGVDDGRALMAEDVTQARKSGEVHAFRVEDVARLVVGELIAKEDCVVVEAQDGLEAVFRESSEELEDLPLCAALLEIGEEIEDLC